VSNSAHKTETTCKLRHERRMSLTDTEAECDVQPRPMLLIGVVVNLTKAAAADVNNPSAGGQQGVQGAFTPLTVN